MAVRHDWDLRAVLCCDGRQLSSWARGVLDHVAAPERVLVAAELMEEIGEKDEGVPELLVVAAIPDDDLARVPLSSKMLVVILDRPAVPGNVGTLVRSADAFGVSGVVVSGHGADPYDPRSVRASTGSIFSVPVVRVPSHKEVLQWAGKARGAGVPLEIVTADEHGASSLADEELTGPLAIVVGNEGRGLSAAWREAADKSVRIPIGGSASSLNAAVAGTVVLYEAARQRGFPGR